jgi:hypothetical protein
LRSSRATTSAAVATRSRRQRATPRLAAAANASLSSAVGAGRVLGAGRCAGAGQRQGKQEAVHGGSPLEWPEA